MSQNSRNNDSGRRQSSRYYENSRYTESQRRSGTLKAQERVRTGSTRPNSGQAYKKSVNPRRKKSYIRKIKRLWRRKENRKPLIIMAAIAVCIIVGIILLITLVFTKPSDNPQSKSISNPETEVNTSVNTDTEETSDEAGDDQNSTDVETQTTTEYTIQSHEVVFTRDEIEISDEEPVPSYDPNWHICVNLPLNMITIYQVDENGNETPVRAMITSVGRQNEETTQGEFYLGEFISNWCYMADGTYGQYSYRIIDGWNNALMFHAIPYYSMDRSTLVYEEFNLLGTAQSLGCLRLMMKDAIWLGTHCGPDTKVSVYYDEYRDEPFERPEGYFIPPKVEEIRGWDPTDPLSSNPWHYYEYSYDIPDTITVAKDSSEDDIYYTIIANVTAIDKYGYDVAEYTTYSGAVDTSTPGYYPVSTYLKLGPITAQKDITVIVE